MGGGEVFKEGMAEHSPHLATKVNLQIRKVSEPREGKPKDIPANRLRTEGKQMSKAAREKR